MKTNDEIPKHRSSKNTRRWCKGVVGREHSPECVPYPCPPSNTSSSHYWRNWQCSTCGKVLKRFWPFVRWTADGKMLPPNDPKPDWVTR
jgi:hypothetical protein